MDSELATLLLKYLPDLAFSRLGDPEEAGAWIISLPWPSTDPAHGASLGLNGRSSLIQKLGRWPGTTHPRRLLMLADGGGTPAPGELRLEALNPVASGEEMELPEMTCIGRSRVMHQYWESHAVELRHRKGKVRIALGLRHGGKVRWWEACRLEILEAGSGGIVAEMGGVIPHDLSLNGASAAHRHNWLNGHLLIRQTPGGVCELYAHFVNGRFFDEGKDLEDAVPVIGFAIEGAELGEREGDWTGENPCFHLGGVAFDLREAAHLATPSQPGQWSMEGGFSMWQPFSGVELFGGAAAESATGDPFLVRPEKRLFPRGMARTIRFSLNLSGGSAAIVRYLPPAWWYGMCGELSPTPSLPVTGGWEPHLEEARDWIRQGAVSSGFEDGAVPRYLHRSWSTPPRYEAGWDGEVPYAQFLNAWRTGHAGDYDLAMRSAWHFTDVAVNHASHLVRMHGWMNAYSLPMNRMQGTLAAYLETGDRYLLDTARAVVENAHWQNRSAWPRHTVGRDACYLRGAVLLYRYSGDTLYRDIAREGALALAASQGSDGSFGDQGGGSGVHQQAGYLSKPWMGLLGLCGVIDYLELGLEKEPQLEAAVLRFAQWLLTERWERDGRTTWSYEHYYLGKRVYPRGPDDHRALPTHPRWHHETLARVLGWSALHTGCADFLNAWLDSYADTLYTPDSHEISSNTVAPVLEYLPWLLDRLGSAHLTAAGISVAPPFTSDRLPGSLRLLHPGGSLPLEMAMDQRNLP